MKSKRKIKADIIGPDAQSGRFPAQPGEGWAFPYPVNEIPFGNGIRRSVACGGM